MIVYHGSSMVVDHPDVTHSYRPLDFGKGFYVTTVKTQAERWARRKALLVGSQSPVLNIYQMNLNTEDFCVKTFDDMSDWIDFVCRCRDGHDDFQKYDVIIGKVANDKVFRVVDMYRMGIWDKQRALNEIRAYENYDQIAFITQKSIDRLLVFQRAEEVQ
ncbi:MAG: DUF3990 domain-containing protein [Clostridia bacterium]|nr:DUF3990 domain-containing protein [Clostridia bacterium]